MSGLKVAPHGSWESPITSDLIVSGTVRIGQIAIDRDDVYWVEMRPWESGRSAIAKHTPGRGASDVLPEPFNARTRVHEYGGGSYAVGDGTVYFSNFADQRVYALDSGKAPRPFTPGPPAPNRPPAFRYADGVIDRRRGRMIAVREDHSAPGREAINTVVSLDLRGDNEDGGNVLAAGHDFYAAPRLHPDGSHLAWLAWNHPDMPWDSAELWVAEIEDDGTLASARKIAGGPRESILEPKWSPAGILHFISDRTGWWNLYRLSDGVAAPGAERPAEPLAEREVEFGQPLWIFGISTYIFLADGRIVCTFSERGVSRLALLTPGTGRLEIIETPYTEIFGLHSNERRVVFGAGSPHEEPCVVELDPETRAITVLSRSIKAAIDPKYLSNPQTIEFPTEGGQKAHAFFYPPRNRDFVAPPGELPPVLVVSHGGPTSATTNTLDFEIQFWTSRGFAVLDVNYRGSTGYGRAYREQLYGQWGIADVDDCVHGALHVVKHGWGDGKRLAIRGGSAGGYTTLSALTFRKTFQAGASHYGISDLEAMTRETHKFESRYLDRMVGPYPERRDLYLARSPIHFADRLSCPVIFFQGLEDKIVTPDQAEMMVAALRRRDVPVAYLAFEGEQHGFRRAENIKRALDAELYFYSRVLGFDLPQDDGREPVVIENLESWR